MKHVWLALLLALSVTAAPEPDSQAVLKEELPKLKAEYRAAPVSLAGRETAIAKTYYGLLNRYVRYASKSMKDWPAEPGARFHKRDGSLEHSVRQNASVALGYAVLATCGNYDESAAGGVKRTTVRADAVALTRYLAITHKANFLPTGDGKKWGDHWQSSYWASLAGQAAWLIWDDLPDDTKVMVARMVAHEASRYNERPPDSGMIRDTKAEENAWNSEMIALAHCMFPKHPNNRLWGERAITYMVNAFSTEADHSDTRIVDGKPLNQWITTTCVLPDFTLENHGRFHPDYLSSFTLSLHNAILYRFAGLKVPEGTLHHAHDCLQVLLYVTATNGTICYVNGQDWWPHQASTALLAAGMVNVLQPDPMAAFMERAALGTKKSMHARFDDGTAFDPRETNYPNPEEDMMFLYTDLYLLHFLFGDGAAPAAAAEFYKRFSGTRIFDSGGFVIHRAPGKFASFAWANGAMGLLFPSEDTWFTAPYERSLSGRVVIDGAKDDPPKLEAKNVAPLRLPGREGDDGFIFVGKFSRCQGKVEQRMAVISLPDAPVLYLEQLSARADINVKEIATGSVAIFNEDAAPLRNTRRVWTAEGEQTLRGASTDPAKLHVWKTTWASVDDQLGVVSWPAGRMSCLENHRYERARLQQILSPNYRDDVGAKKAGEVLSESVVALVPNAVHTAQTKMQVEKTGKNGFAVSLGTWRIMANLGDEALSTSAWGQKRELNALSAAVMEEAR